MPFARTIYSLGRYTGLRAVLNKQRAKDLALPDNAQPWCGRTLTVPGFAPMGIELHPRRSPLGQTSTRRFFMLSARMTQPKIAAWRYAYLLRTSHFGCGHMELACYEEHGLWAVHGIRNMAADTAQALRWTRTAEALRTNAGPTDVAFLRCLIEALQATGLPARLLPALECVQLSVNPELLPASHRPKRMQALVRRYEGLHEELAN
ncbi:MAG: hypothetical protein ACI8QC_001993 [Planctomycetota bacterium]|jgi:hypothetical protein